ncbi:cell surface protein [Methanosarcina barkeri str. Wiesmoor]|uniref:Cell surface protein n=2 Tax=Methanosarcina barkeri TaxID=2208 RepID=A0A0E3QME8_METBA|nr:PKD domain-containing protein [Methanosarcina barkeri]AKB51143.1 cell surface protein [Methanosarcina barkeri str. Wiesmoor]
MWVNKLTVFSAVAIFLITVVYSPASAREITVDNNGSGADFRSIQEAVNNSSSGDTVLVMPGTYNENIIVNINSLTIKSKSKNPEVLVKSLEENKSVFLITASNVTLSGFNITGAKGSYTYYPSGICLKNTRNCKITGNTLFENYLGVCLVNADYNIVSKNFLFNSSISLNEGSNMNNLRDNALEEGPISLSYSRYNTISENSLFNGSISMGESGMNNLTNNTIEKGSIFLAAWCSLNLISKNKILNGQGISIACCGGGDNISDNVISNCSTGVSTYDHGIDVINNSIIDCYRGIYIAQSPSRIHNNTILNCSTGITVMDSTTDISNNIIISSAKCGLSIPDREFDERVYNNYFNNTINVRLGNHDKYTWNSSRVSGTNIVGGPYLGGNYWANPNGTGFSEACTDSDGDWICDSPYNLNGSDFDFLPLASISRTQNPPVANFSINITQGLAPFSVQFTDSSQHALLWNWDFDNDGKSDSTEKDPVYEYKAPGNYTVNLTVSNAKGTASKAQKIIAQDAKSLPVADFSVNTTKGQAPLSVIFTDLSQNVAKRAWDFNNDGITDSTNKTAVYTYTFPGTYIVNLTVGNSKGSFSKLFPITVSPVRRVDGQLILTEYQITTNGVNPSRPAIYKDRIVWSDNRNGNPDIYTYDLSTSMETQITTIKSYDYSPEIYGDRIVWTDYRNGNGDIYLYNLSTKKETQITTNESASNPKIYEDKIIWVDYRNGDIQNFSNPDIFMYDLSTHNETQISSSASDDFSPDIYGDRIVWCAKRHESENSSIYMYDLSTSKNTKITTNESQHMNPVIYGDRIIWEDYLNEKRSIHIYNLSTSTETQIATSQSGYHWPAIYENRVLWADYRNGHIDIYMYDLSTQKETRITTNGLSFAESAIYGDKVVWTGNINGKSNIYMCIISEEGKIPEPPIPDFSAFPTSGGAPLKVLFTDNSTGGPTSWLWDFGDGINSKHALNATHTFNEPGKYNVSLIVNNANGSATKTIPECITVFKKE